YSAALILRAMQTGTPDYSDNRPETGMHGVLADLVRVITSAPRHARPSGSNVLAIIRAWRRKAHAGSLESSASQNLNGGQGAEGDLTVALDKVAYALGKDLRQSIEMNTHKSSKILEALGYSENAHKAVSLLRDKYISSAWHNIRSAIT